MSRYFLRGHHLVAGVPGRIQNATGDLVIDAITIAFQETNGAGETNVSDDS